MHNRILLPLLAIPALLATAAYGQGTQQSTGGTGWYVTTGGGPGGRPVTGQPYSAEETYQTVQTLADGTHITHQSTTTKMYRDSQGRTRTDRMLGGRRGQANGEAGPVMVMINDPVAHVIYRFNSDQKVVHKISMVAPEAQRVPAVANARGTAAPAPMSQPRDGAPIAAPQVTSEKLGTQSMEGLVVEGTRQTTVWPVGSRDNDQPITAVEETWRSPELRIVVMSTTNDPVNGTTTRKLTNITRAEPDASLFQPPADYGMQGDGGPAPR